jgi:putative ABC transport system substrate-binding protein
MRRRKFIAGLSGAALMCPRLSRAQQAPKVWRVGVLEPGPPPSLFLDLFRAGLRDLGYVEGRNLTLEIRWAEGRNERLPALAAELVALKVDAIKTQSTPAALAARAATSTIPVVFTGVGDPVGANVVADLAHPGGNVTGISLLATELSAKRLEILRELVPDMSPVAMLWNDTNPGMVLRAHETEKAAGTMGVAIHSYGVHDLITLDPAFEAITIGRAAAVVTLIDPFTLQNRQRIVDFAAERRLPAIYEAREFVQAGGLISYGPNQVPIHRRAAFYLDRIFKGTKPADLPVEQPSKFELVISLKTAKALGIAVPPALLVRADEVIE